MASAHEMRLCAALPRIMDHAALLKIHTRLEEQELEPIQRRDEGWRFAAAETLPG